MQPTLDPLWSARRQRRLLAVLEERRLDAIVVGLPYHVYYLSTFLPHWTHLAAFALTSDGDTLLAAPNQPAADAVTQETVAFAANWMSTLRQEQPALAAEKIAPFLRERLRGSGTATVGVDASAVSSQLTMQLDARFVGIDSDLWQLRRRKDPDELELMKATIRCTDAMHRRARQIVEPGVPELKVFAELHAAALEIAGEPLTSAIGNDYACGCPGGAPRGGRVARSGEIYILDLGPAFRGYYADNTRSLAVGGQPTDAQLTAHEALMGCFDIVERMTKPGARCRDIFAAVDDHMRHATGQPFPHHLGHGVGLQPHEYPHLNPNWDDVLQGGEVIAVEPGLYGPELGGGMRIEDQYLVTESGVDNLVNLPRGLA